MPQARKPRQSQKPPRERGKNTTADKSKADERSRRANAILNLRLHGAPIARIAEQLPQLGFAKVSITQLRRIIRAALEDAAHRPAEELLRIELLRLDELQNAQYAKAITGDNSAMDRVLAIMDRRAKLLGLHQPQRAEPAAENPEDARAALLEKLETIAERIKATESAAENAASE